VNQQEFIDLINGFGRKMDFMFMATKHFRERVNHVRNHRNWIGIPELERMFTRMFLSYNEEFRCSPRVKYLVYDAESQLNIVMNKKKDHTLELITVWRNDIENVTNTDFDKLLTV